MIGDVVRAERERRGWTQQDLATRTGLVQSYISRLEQNRRPNPTADVLKRLAQAFGIAVDELLRATHGADSPPLDELRAEGVPEAELVRLQTVWAELAPEDREILLQLAYKLARAGVTDPQTTSLVE